MWGRYPRDSLSARRRFDSYISKLGFGSHRITWPGGYYDPEVLQALRWDIGVVVALAPFLSRKLTG